MSHSEARTRKLIVFARSSLDEQTDRPKGQKVWNVTILVLHSFFWFSHKNNSLTLGTIQPSSPHTKELHGVCHEQANAATFVESA